jgi:hypothetical protein
MELSLVALVQKKAMEAVKGSGHVKLIPYGEECPVTLFSREDLALLRSADLILQTPTYYPHTKELMTALEEIPSMRPMPKMEMVGEYGYLESSWFHPKSDGFSMGLHFLEKGILVKKAQGPVTLDDVENERLRGWLRPKNQLFVAYLTTMIGGAIYLHALLKAEENEKRNIDLCIPDLGWFIQYIEMRKQEGRPILEWDLGIHKLEVLFEDQIHSMVISPEGKTVRLLCPGLISQRDFRTLLTLSGDFVAVRGDQSFSEAVSADKVYFYDLREHARYFIKDLLAVAENRIIAHPTSLTLFRCMAKALLHNLPEQEGEWVDETFFQEKEEWSAIAFELGLALQKGDTAIGCKQLNEILKREFSAAPFLCQLVERALFHRIYPEIEKIEKEEMDLFLSGTQSYLQTIAAVRECLHDTRSIQSNGR